MNDLWHENKTQLKYQNYVKEVALYNAKMHTVCGILEHIIYYSYADRQVQYVNKMLHITVLIFRALSFNLI